MHKTINSNGHKWRKQMKVQLDQSAYMPDRAHPEDAGADLKTPKDSFSGHEATEP